MKKKHILEASLFPYIFPNTCMVIHLAWFLFYGIIRCVCPIKPHIPDSETRRRLHLEFLKPDFANRRTETKQGTQQKERPTSDNRVDKDTLHIFIVLNCIASKSWKTTIDHVLHRCESKNRDNTKLKHKTTQHCWKMNCTSDIQRWSPGWGGAVFPGSCVHAIGGASAVRHPPHLLTPGLKRLNMTRAY